MKKNKNLHNILFAITIYFSLGLVIYPKIYFTELDSRKQKLVDVTKEIFVEAKRRFKSGNTTKVISSKDDTKLNFYGDLLEYCVIIK